MREFSRDQKREFARLEMRVVLARNDERVRFADAHRSDRYEWIVAYEHERGGNAHARGDARGHVRDVGELTPFDTHARPEQPPA